ncbi:MAG: hypothetical protein M9920_12170 [Verrucomicrobiae bacterium]|nr:hypothetical protein [Verrucomicrobiae bacterium]
MKPDEVERLICAARKPDASFYERLAVEMQALNASKKAKKLESWDADLIGNLETTVKELTRVVEADWQENMTEKLPCEFEYQMIRAADPVDHLKVLTRLYKDGDPQSIFYGRSIAKLEDNKFVLWA